MDSGSTHNFLSNNIAKKVGLVPSSQGCLEVGVANGDKLTSLGRCKGAYMSQQGVPITVDLYPRPLEGCDAVLGDQWLRTLGPIVWDFSKLHMKFQIGVQRGGAARHVYTRNKNC